MTARRSSLNVTRLELDRLALEIPADRRTIMRELLEPGTVRGRVGERIREALAALRAAKCSTTRESYPNLTASSSR